MPCRRRGPIQTACMETAAARRPALCYITHIFEMRRAYLQEQYRNAGGHTSRRLFPTSVFFSFSFSQLKIVNRSEEKARKSKSDLLL